MAWTRRLCRPASMSQNDCKTSRSRPPRSLRPCKPTRYAARSTVSLAYHTFLQHLLRFALWVPASCADAPITAGIPRSAVGGIRSKGATDDSSTSRPHHPGVPSVSSLIPSVQPESRAPPATAAVLRMHRGQEAIVLMHSRLLSIPVQTRTLPSLTPSFRRKGRQEFTHRHSH